MKIARIVRLLRSHLAVFALALWARVLSALEKKLLAAIDAAAEKKGRLERKSPTAPSE